MEPETFEDFVNQQPLHISRLLSHCDLSDEAVEAVCESITQTNCLHGGLDGGLLNGDEHLGLSGQTHALKTQ